MEILLKMDAIAIKSISRMWITVLFVTKQQKALYLLYIGYKIKQLPQD